MRIFLDTADVDAIRTYAAWGVIDGVTTNPSLIKKSGRVFEEVVEEICGIVDGPVSAEVTALDADGMVAQAKPLAKIHPNVVIKVPLIPEGLKATRALTELDVPDQRHALLLRHAGPARGQGRRDLRVAPSSAGSTTAACAAWS